MQICLLIPGVEGFFGQGNLTCCVSQHRAKTAAMEFSKHDPLLKSNPQVFTQSLS